MKKTVLFIALALGVSGAFAQTASTGLVSKKGETILPEAGDWAVGIDASPILKYVGSFLSSGGNNAPTWNYPGTPLAITGKYFKDEKTAYRGMIRLGFGSNTTNAYSQQDGQTATPPDPTVVVKDSKTVSQHNIVLGGGMEMRRGKTRLQGFYGAMLMIGMMGSDTSYKYGNALTATSGTRTNFGTNSVGGGTWVTDNKAGSTFVLGIRAFIGAEYFILPKISIGAEFGWGLGFRTTGDGQKTTEFWDAPKNPTALNTQKMKTGGGGSFGIDTDINSTMMIPAGQLMLIMHF